MAVNIDDALSAYLGDTRSNHRRDVWLWLYLETHHEAELKPEECNGFNMRDRLASILHEKRMPLDKITTAMNHFLAPAECLKWIAEDERLTQWLALRLEEVSNNYWARRRPRLLGKDLVTGLLDIWDAELREKTKTLNRLREEWLYLKSLDYQLKWFEEKSESKQRCQFAWSWLQKHAPKLTDDTLPVENYLELLMLFDKADLREAERTLIAQNIRRAWNRRQYLEKMEGKKQCNTFLPEEIINLLDGLVNKHGLKRPQVLEILIQMEAERGSYLGTSAGQMKHAATTPGT